MTLSRYVGSAFSAIWKFNYNTFSIGRIGFLRFPYNRSDDDCFCKGLALQWISTGTNLYYRTITVHLLKWGHAPDQQTCKRSWIKLFSNSRTEMKNMYRTNSYQCQMVVRWWQLTVLKEVISFDRLTAYLKRSQCN